MRRFKSMRSALIAEFIEKYPTFVEWARQEHNGTFDASLYDVKKAEAAFYFRTEPIPVPDSSHFETTVTSLLGVDAESVDQRVREARLRAEREPRHERNHGDCEHDWNEPLGHAIGDATEIAVQRLLPGVVEATAHVEPYGIADARLDDAVAEKS